MQQAQGTSPEREKRKNGSVSRRLKMAASAWSGEFKVRMIRLCNGCKCEIPLGFSLCDTCYLNSTETD